MYATALMALEWHPFSIRADCGGSYLLPRGIAPNLIGVAGEPINSATDINVIAEAAGSCQSYDPLFEKQREGGTEAETRGTV